MKTTTAALITRIQYNLKEHKMVLAWILYSIYYIRITKDLNNVSGIILMKTIFRLNLNFPITINGCKLQKPPLFLQFLNVTLHIKIFLMMIDLKTKSLNMQCEN